MFNGSCFVLERKVPALFNSLLRFSETLIGKPPSNCTWSITWVLLLPQCASDARHVKQEFQSDGGEWGGCVLPLQISSRAHRRGASRLVRRSYAAHTLAGWLFAAPLALAADDSVYASSGNYLQLTLTRQDISATSPVLVLVASGLYQL